MQTLDRTWDGISLKFTSLVSFSANWPADGGLQLVSGVELMNLRHWVKKKKKRKENQLYGGSIVPPSGQTELTWLNKHKYLNYDLQLYRAQSPAYFNLTHASITNFQYSLTLTLMGWRPAKWLIGWAYGWATALWYHAIKNHFIKSFIKSFY